MSRDISERKRAEEELRSSEERLRILFEFAPDAYYLSDVKGLFVDGNRAAEELTGYQRGELTGKDLRVLNLLPPEQTGEAAKAAAAHGPRKTTGPREFVLTRKGGARIPVEVRTFPVKIRGRTLALSIARDISEQKRARQELSQSLEHVKLTLEATVRAMAAAMEKRDPYTAGHQERVARLACAVAERMGLPAEQLEAIRVAGALHDIGKASIPSEILSKPGPLTELEMSIIKEHPESAYQILKGIPFAGPVAEIVLEHHERMDGSGYPLGIAREGIRRGGEDPRGGRRGGSDSQPPTLPARLRGVGGAGGDSQASRHTL